MGKGPVQYRPFSISDGIKSILLTTGEVLGVQEESYPDMEIDTVEIENQEKNHTQQTGNKK